MDLNDEFDEPSFDEPSFAESTVSSTISTTPNNIVVPAASQPVHLAQVVAADEAVVLAGKFNLT